MSDVDISVIIPTLNRADLLPQVVSSIRTQTLSANRYEIIIVDNGSTDDTAPVVKSLRTGSSPKLRYVYEPRRGLHWARHAGAAAARADIISFTDDDAIVSPGWLELLINTYADATVGAAGGPIKVRWRTPPADWVPPLRSFGDLEYGPEPQDLKWPQAINGANYSLRKSILYEVGGFNPDTAVEDKLNGDGERGLCRKIFAAGWRIVFIPAAVVYHVQDGYKITLPVMRHRYAQQGRFFAYEDHKLNRPSVWRMFGYAGQHAYLAGRRKLLALGHQVLHGPKYYRHEVKAADHWARAGYYGRMAASPRFRKITLRENWLPSALQ